MRCRVAPAGAALLVLAILWSRAAWAEDTRPTSEEELAAARAVFADALVDQDGGRLGVALAKLQRVKDVRDTAQVEYRIAACEEGLGHFVAAATAYRAALRLAEANPAGQEVISVARERLDAVERRVGHVTIATPAPPPPGAEILVDGSPAASLADVPLDPGPHVVTGRAAGTVPARVSVVVVEGWRGSVLLPFVPEAGTERAPPGRSSWPAWLALAGGATLGAAGGVVLYAREHDIASLDRQCPNGACPPGTAASRDSLESTRSRALTEGPVALGLAAAGAVSIGVGLVLLIRAPAGSGTPRAGISAGLTCVVLEGEF